MSKYGIMILSLFLGSTVWAASWRMQTSYTLVDPQDKIFKIKKSSLDFLGYNGQKITYSPGKPPWGLTKHTLKVVNGKTYFVTAWAQGSMITHFKVFEPDSGATPVCEVSSAKEDISLRSNQGKLQIQLAYKKPDGKFEKRWSDCSR